MAEYSQSKEVVPGIFQYMVGAIFSLEAMATACIYSVGPLYILDTSGVTEGSTSLIMSAASLLGIILTFLIISSGKRAITTSYKKSRLHFTNSNFVGYPAEARYS